MNSNELELELERLRTENAALKAAKVHKPTLKVGKSGGLSVYGLQRWPITLYSAQWTRLLDCADEIRNFMTANADKLKTKE